MPRNSKILLLTTMVITLGLLFGLPKLKISNSLDGWFVQGDETLLQYKAYLEEFGSDEVIIIGVESSKKIHEKKTIILIDQLHQKLLKIKNVNNVKSLASNKHLASLPTKSIASILQNEGNHKRLLGADGKSSLMYVFPENLTQDEEKKVLIENVKQVLANADVQGSYQFHLAGTGILFNAINESSNEDLARVFIPSVLIAGTLLLLSLRSFISVMIVSLSTTISSIWILGVFGLTNTPLNMVTTMVPTIVAVITIANTLHLLKEPDDHNLGLFTMTPVKKACLFSTLTSSMAFMVLSVSDIQILRELGVFAAIGILMAFITSIAICLPLKQKFQKRIVYKDTFSIQSGLYRFGVNLLNRKYIIIIVLSIIAVFSFFGLIKLESDTFSLGYLPKSHQVRRDSQWIEKQFGYYVPLEFEISGNSNTLDSAKTNAITATLYDTLKEIDLIDRIQINPDQKLKGFRIKGGIVMAKVSVLKKTINQSISLIQEHVGNNFEVKCVGYMPVYIKLTRYLGSSFVKSLPFAIGLNFLLLLFLFKSFKWAILSVIPNVFPLFVVLGGLGWLNFDLDLAVVSISCAAFGILVDDTIHLIVHCRANIEKGFSSSESACLALRDGGSTITWTTLIMCGGFIAFMGAHVEPVKLFGTLLASTLLIGLICDILLIPILVSFVKNTKTKE